MARLRNPHPGEILKEEFLSAIGMSQNEPLIPSVCRVIASTPSSMEPGILRAIPICAYASFSTCLKAISCGSRNAYDTLEAKRRIAEQVAKIKPYKPSKAA